MKAAERKENETNSLRMWLFHVQERLKGRSVYLAGGLAVLLLAGGLGIRYWLISRDEANSTRNLEFAEADTEKQLKEISNSDSNQGKQTAVWARLQLARILLYREGFDRLGADTPLKRNEAVEKLDEGRKRYSEIAAELKDQALQQEDYVSLALAEEVLCGTPKPDKTDEYRGSIDKAIDYYRKAAAINPDSAASKKYAAAADKLKNKQGETETFYRTLNRLGFTPKQPVLP
jgi:tetratricopeptide (TPR) repeat protein